MKKIILSILLIIAASAFSNVFGQRETPAGAGDSTLADNNVKLRSVELERIKRDAEKAGSPFNPEISSVNYKEIKEDFENIQIAEAAIIKAYTTGKTIDYAMIETSAKGVNKNAKRLDSNLFVLKLEKKKEDGSAKKEEKPKSIKDMIVELDNALGSFLSSKLFVNMKVVEPEVAKKAQIDLAEVMLLSEMLSKEAGKMKQP